MQLSLCGSLGLDVPLATSKHGLQSPTITTHKLFWLILSSVCPCPSILSTATCEPQRRRSVQDLPGIGTESSQVSHSHKPDMNGRGSMQLHVLGQELLLHLEV